MTEAEHKTALYDMLYLTSCGITMTIPDITRIEKMNLENVYIVSKSHFLNAVTYYAVESAGIPDNEILKKWRESRDKAIRKNMMLDAGRNQLFSFLEDKGIWHMSLKGVILKEMYPKMGMRQMSDNDILFDERFRETVHDWFIKNGYECEAYKKGNHDVYEKQPVYNYEMHVSLYSEQHKESFQEYYKNVFDRLLKNDDEKFGYHFSDEDFYIYITTHAFKHFDTSGTGIRSLLDTYAYLKIKENFLDWSYIERETEKLEISEYEKKCHELSRKVFDNPNSFNVDMLSEDEQEMLDYFLFSGTYGNVKNRISKTLDKIEKDTGKRSKLQYYKRRIFLDMNIIKSSYPFFYRYKILIPFLWIYRIFRAFTVSRKNVFGEIKTLKNLK